MFTLFSVCHIELCAHCIYFLFYQFTNCAKTTQQHHTEKCLVNISGRQLRSPSHSTTMKKKTVSGDKMFWKPFWFTVCGRNRILREETTKGTSKQIQDTRSHDVVVCEYSIVFHKTKGAKTSNGKHFFTVVRYLCTAIISCPTFLAQLKFSVLTQR